MAILVEIPFSIIYNNPDSKRKVEKRDI